MNENRAPDRHELTRRQFVQGTALAGFATFLAACGRAGTSAAPSTAVAPSTAPSSAASVVPSASAAPTPKPTMSADLNLANWTYYMDADEATGKFKTLEQFKAKYGTKVNYEEVIDDNDTFIGTITPQLQAGQDTGWDLIVVTDWMAARLIRLGWVEQMDLGNMPNVTTNLQDVYKNVPWDPTNDHHVPWQSGMTGLGYDRQKTGDLTSLDALFDLKYKGNIDYLTEMRDALGLTMLKLGLDPAQGHERRLRRRGRRDQARPGRGHECRVQGQRLRRGPQERRRRPVDGLVGRHGPGDPGEEGPAVHDRRPGRHALDRQLPDPEGAAHAYTAQVMIDFVYRPEVAAQIEAYVNYICPVKGAAEVLIASDPDVASNPLIFPPPEILAKLHIFIGLDEATEKYFNEQFATVTGLG